ncbi:hypothetical protein E2C01_058434 [Portunus trituberculatus]|uniref:Uncharacterized protein n=1 Tax=Portunus trituberculatus TaxID=210409 RepID=A0A5B7GZT2_PORTR|nr:hypothetical protein [Portunus trituberculatus]
MIEAQVENLFRPAFPLARYIHVCGRALSVRRASPATCGFVIPVSPMTVPRHPSTLTAAAAAAAWRLWHF